MSSRSQALEVRLLMPFYYIPGEGRYNNNKIMIINNNNNRENCVNAKSKEVRKKCVLGGGRGVCLVFGQCGQHAYKEDGVEIALTEFWIGTRVFQSAKYSETTEHCM